MNQQPVILCVDDEALNLALLEAVLAPRGYRVVLVQDGDAALGRLRNERIDLVLLDVMMPGMDGYEVCRQIKEDEALRAIPVVMITAYAAKENRIQGIEAGAEEFLSKPFDSAEVLARVAMLLKVKGLHDQLATAYQYINSLIRHGQQLTARFDPLHYNVMDGITSVVKQLVAASPQAGTGLGILGGEKRFPDRVQLLRVNPRPVVFYATADSIVRPAQGNGQRPLFLLAHGVGGVLDEIHENLLHLLGIGHDRRQVRG